MSKVTLDEVLNESLWVARMCGGARFVGPYDKIKKWGSDENCKDIDTVCTEGQPVKLQKFWKDYWDYVEKTHGKFITIQEFYPIWEKEYN